MKSSIIVLFTAIAIGLLLHRNPHLVEIALDRLNSFTAQPQPLEPTITSSPEMSVARAIAKAFKAVEKSEGAGARVRRSIGVPQLRNFSPFLMLDHFSVGDGAGFPDHPHR